MEYIQALFLGVVQGLTEFLPVSSSGHLNLLPKIFGWQEAGLAFDAALHLGTLGAVFFFFWKKIWAIVQGFVACLFSKTHSFANNQEGRLGLFILFAILPAGIIGYLYDDLIETSLRDPRITISMLIAIGILFLGIEVYNKKSKHLAEITLRDALIIGVLQTLALIPGVSRSGITMLTALVLGYKHKDAAVFSFLLGTPLIFAAGMMKLKELSQTSVDMAYVAIGILSALISGFLCIKYFLKFLEKHSFQVFGWYRIAFGVLVYILLFF